MDYIRGLGGKDSFFCIKVICKSKNLMTGTIVGLEHTHCVGHKEFQALCPQIQFAWLYSCPCYKRLYIQLP